MLAEDGLVQSMGPVRTGVCQKFAPVSSSEQGLWSPREDGSWLWTISFSAAGAKSVRLHLSSFSPPAGAELFVYAPNDPQSVCGPMTATYQPWSELWTPTIFGSTEIRLEYWLPSEFQPDNPDIHIVIDSLLNNYREFGPLGGGPPEGGPRGAPLPCQLDVQCYPEWDLQSRGVAALSFVSDPFGFVCTGSMLNRTGEDFTPLLVTAFHCGIDSNNAPSVLATWFFRTNSCNGSVPNLNSLPQTPGIVLLKSVNAHDMTLVGLSRQNNAGVTFQGWSNTSWSSGSPTAGIHHPEGSWQRILFGFQDGTAGSCIDGAEDGWENDIPEGNGLTQPGSSGSPIFDSNGRVRGTLSCGTIDCNDDNTDVYGRFDQAFANLQPFLNPTDPIHLDSGYFGNETGTSGQPFNTVLEGTFAVLAGSTIFLDSGNYDGPSLTIDKPVTLRSVGGTATIR